MSKKGGSEERTQEVRYELPDYIKGPITRMIAQAEAAAAKPYVRYTGDRLAAITPTTQHGINLIRGLSGLQGQPASASPYVDIEYTDIPERPPTPAGSTQLDALNARIAELQRQIDARNRREASARRRSGDERGGQAGERDRGGSRSSRGGGGGYGGDMAAFQDGGAVTAQFPEIDEARDITSEVGSYQAGNITTGRFDEDAARQYMNPYVEQVLDRLEGRTRERYARDLRDISAQAVQAGAFGGSRATLAGLQRQEDLFQELGDVEAEQLAAAYDAAQRAFTTDEERTLQAATAQETAAQGAAGLRLGAGGQLAGLGQLRQALTLEQADASIRAGQLQQQENQRAADIAYEEFLREQGWDAEQARSLATIRGTGTYAPQSTTTTPQPAPSPWSGIAGLGLGVAGLAGQYGWFGL